MDQDEVVRVPGSSKSLTTFERAMLLLQIHSLQVTGALPARGDGAGLDALLVQLGLTQSEVAWLFGKSQQGVSLSVKRLAESRAKGSAK